MKSWLGYFSAYVRKLEEDITSLRIERDQLLNRIIVLSTGWPLSKEMPEQQERPSKNDEAPLPGMAAARASRNFDLMREYENYTKDPALLAEEIQDLRTEREVAQDAALKAHKNWLDAIGQTQRDMRAAPVGVRKNKENGTD